MARCFAVYVFLCMLAAVTRAEIMGANSLEWLAISTPVIVRGVVETYVDAPEESNGQKRVTVRITHVLKGAFPAKTVTVDLNTAWAAPKEQLVNPVAHACLLFLRPDEKDAIATYVGCNAPGLTIQSFIDLQAPRDVYSKAMTILTDSDRILGVVKEWALSKITDSLQREVPWDSPIYARLYSGSSVFLVVPADESYRAEYLEQAHSPRWYERADAASVLRLYPGMETEAVLRELLQDDAKNFSCYSADFITSVEYPVRTSVAASLRALGKDVPTDLVLARKPTAEEQRTCRQDYWHKSFKEGLPAGWAVENIADGEALLTSIGNLITVIVTIQRNTTTARFILTPIVWDDVAPPAGKYLGRQNCLGGRRFYIDGDLPVEVEEKLFRHFGLI